ncbi:MAG: hypothetical protein WB558_23035 [Terriglobales bacterium]
MEAEERSYYVWLSIFTILLGTAPFAYWQGYHFWASAFALAGLGGLLMLIRDHLAVAISKWPKVSLKVLAVVALSLIVSQLIGHEMNDHRAIGELSSTQWYLYGLALLLIAVVVSAALSKGKPSKLVIHSANYQAAKSGGTTYDVGEFLAKIISGDSLVFDIENHNFVIDGHNYVPHDPFTGEGKRLQITYSYGDEPRKSIVRYEHSRLVLPEDHEIQRLTNEMARLNTQSESDLYRCHQVSDQLRAEAHTAKERMSEVEKELTRLQTSSTTGNPSKSDLRKEAEELSDEIRDFLKKLGPRPDRKPSGKQNTKLEEEEAIREHSASLVPWLQRLQGGWVGRFADRAEKTRYLLAEQGITDVDLDMALRGSNSDENNMLRVADRLLLLSRAESKPLPQAPRMN